MFERLKEDIQVVFDRDPAVRSALEVLICYPGFHALQFHRLAHWLWHRNWRLLARTISHFSRLVTGIEIHPGAKIGRGFFIDHGMGVVIGETAEIGDNCTLYHGVTLGGTSWAKEKRHPTLGNDVVVGAGAKILGPFFVADGSKIGSNSVVVKPVPENATVVGIPAKVVVGMKDRKEHKVSERPDLEHGKLPDVQGRNTAELMNKMHAMEQRLAELEQELNEYRHSGE
jgi:serine O-acetyltransferase